MNVAKPNVKAASAYEEQSDVQTVYQHPLTVRVERGIELTAR